MNYLPKVLIISLTLILSALYFSNVALAAELAQNKTPNPHSQGASRSAAARQKLDAVKLKVCLSKQDNILKRSEQLARNAANMEEKFDAKVQRVKDFYTFKVVPSGKTVANYDSLVSNIVVKKSAVQTALTKAQGDLAVFSCNGADPKGLMKSFQEDMKAVKLALKDYRTSIKDLIVGVHGVTGDENSSADDNSALKSPKPTKAPKTGGPKP